MTDNTSDASATQTGLSPTVEPASSLAGSAASIPSAMNECRDDGGDHFLCGCITDHARKIARHWTGTNCTWADDDITAIGILAGHAIQAGLHRNAALPTSLIKAIDDHAASAMSAFGQDPQGLEAQPASAVPQADAHTCTPSSESHS